MFPNQMFPTNGQVPTAPIPQMTQVLNLNTYSQSIKETGIRF